MYVCLYTFDVTTTFVISDKINTGDDRVGNAFSDARARAVVRVQFRRIIIGNWRWSNFADYEFALRTAKVGDVVVVTTMVAS
jgi:hypothetical protein